MEGLFLEGLADARMTGENGTKRWLCDGVCYFCHSHLGTIQHSFKNGQVIRHIWMAGRLGQLGINVQFAGAWGEKLEAMPV